MATAQELREASSRLQEVAELEEEAENDLDEIREMITQKMYVVSDNEICVDICKKYNMNMSQAKRIVEEYPPSFQIYEETVPDIIKDMRKERRKLKGELREKMTKSIDSLIDGYSEYLQKCIDSIYWLTPYQSALKKMKYNEIDLKKLYSLKDLEPRREIVESLCKYWEAELEQNNMAYGKEYSSLQKQMNLAKAEFRKSLSNITDYSVRKSIKEEVEDFIIKCVCENQGITSRQIHDKMPSKLYDRTSWNSISKISKSLDIVSLEGKYYKINSEIKKNIWAYTAAFIDSDGYITMDRNFNPRVGLIATGDRGKIFMEEMHKSIGFGKLHLNQKSPQDTRPVNRLNFYSQDDVYNLLTKCMPHFKLKKGNAELLIELIRMKKAHKKADWYAERCDQLFKLMKWENHKDHVGYDFAKEGIYVDDIQKYRDNCKMSVMDELEQVGVLIKQDTLKAKIKSLKQAYYLDKNKPETFDMLTRRYGLPTHPKMHYYLDYKKLRELGFTDEQIMKYVEAGLDVEKLKNRGYTQEEIEARLRLEKRGE